jgi:CheY-like chemotaxis protein
MLWTSSMVENVKDILRSLSKQIREEQYSTARFESVKQGLERARHERALVVAWASRSNTALSTWWRHWGID